MKQRYSFLILVSLSFSLANAQIDSTWIDLGRIRLKKDFTQSITVRGAALEQMPFSTLDEALNVWLYGVGTNPATVTYVVDGNLLVDVHAYSIHDIEEITLVQNALVQLNGATQEKQLLLVSTKKDRPSASGIAVAGSAYVTSNRTFTGYDHQTALYHRYDISAWKHTDKLKYGVSAGYLHDVYPYYGGTADKINPARLDRFRIHGYLNARLNAHNNVWLRAGYVPDAYKWQYEAYSGLNTTNKINNKSSLYSLEAGWTATIGQHVTNELRAGYVPVIDRTTTSYQFVINTTVPSHLETFLANTKQNFNSLLLSDRIGFHMAAGNWSLDPAIDLSFRKVNIHYRYNSRQIENASGSTVNYSEYDFKQDFHSFLLTPSVDLSFKNIFDVQGGLVFNASENDDQPKPRKALPFVSTTVDVWKLFNGEGQFSWKLFGSYAVAGNVGDLRHNNQAVYGSYETVYPYKTNTGQITNNNLTFGGDSANRALQAGTTVSGWNGRIQGSYSFERRKYTVDIFGPGSGPIPPEHVPVNIFSTVHRLGVTFKPFNHGWVTAFSLSALKSDAEARINTSIPAFWEPINKDETLWTGGWANRFQFGKFSAGLDLLYVFNIKDYAGYGWGNNNALSFRNIYAGYKFNLLDVFVECRNPGQSHKSNMHDKRAYYGVGFKLHHSSFL